MPPSPSSSICASTAVQLARPPPLFRSLAALFDMVLDLGTGTGVSFDWSLAAELAVAHDIGDDEGKHDEKEATNHSSSVSLQGRLPLIVAGGLRPDNVAEAVAACHPWAVDVAGGVELPDRTKDLEKIKVFIQRAKMNA